MALALGLLFATSLARGGEIKTVVEHSDNAHASSEFKFKRVPPVAKDDAASRAKLSVVSGMPDPNSGDLEKLTDGKLPSYQDEPDQNFFFTEGADGGRLLLDLGSVIAVRQVNVYSWHPNTRGPQVYKLYAADGDARGFDAAPKEGTDPENKGWTPIASVDTRPRKADGTVNNNDAAMGGQYGVSISDSAGGEIGKYRYLLFVISRTEDRDEWGNTFFNEIDVIDCAAPVTTPTTRPIK